MAMQQPAKGIKPSAVKAAFNQADSVTVMGRSLEPALRALVEGTGQPDVFRLFPLYFHGSKAVANGVQQVEQQRFKLRQV